MTSAIYCWCSLGCCFSAELPCSAALLLIQFCVLRLPRRTSTLSGGCRKRGERFLQGGKGSNRSQRCLSVPAVYWCSWIQHRHGFKLTPDFIPWGSWGERRKRSGTVERCCSTTGVFLMCTKSLQAEILDWQSAQGSHLSNCSFLSQIVVVYFTFSIPYTHFWKCYFP